MQIEMFDLRSVKHVCPAGQPISRAPSRHGRPPASSVRCSSSNGVSHNNTPRKAKDAKEAKQQSSLDERILSGEFTTPPSWRTRFLSGLQGLFGKSPTGPGRGVAFALAKAGRKQRAADRKVMPEATGDIREIVGQPVFLPLFKLFTIYGKIFRLSFGPKSFVIISDAQLAKKVLVTNAAKYSKGLLSEILDFVMGQGLIPADGDVWKVRRRAIVPAIHKRYVAAMVDMFGECALHSTSTLSRASRGGQPVEMENFFSRLALDIIGKAVFDYDFDSLTHDDPIIQAVYTTLREAEYRSTAFIPYWNFAPLRAIVPRQRRCTAALGVVNTTLDGLISKCKRLIETLFLLMPVQADPDWPAASFAKPSMGNPISSACCCSQVEVEDQEFQEEFLGDKDPSILHFLLASGEEISSKQLRDDLMTMLIAGHETTAAVLTWTMYCLTKHPEYISQIQAEVDAVVGDGKPTFEDLKRLSFTMRVINESMRLYPQPPVLIRRALEEDELGGYHIPKGSDFFISVWNLHRSPEYWNNPEEFNPYRFPVSQPVPNEVNQDYAYLPFGAGRRKCIGDQFALFESVVILAMLFRRFDFKMDSSAPAVGMTTGATIHTSDGLYMNVSPRSMPELMQKADEAERPALKIPQEAVA